MSINNFLRGLLGRSLEAGGVGRRWRTHGTSQTLNQDLYLGGALARGRALHAARNNPWLASGVNALVANAVGDGIRPQSVHPDAGMRERLHDLWLRWTDEADADGRGDFYALQALAVRSMVETGEGFARFRPRLLSDGLTVPLQLQLLAPDQVPMDASRDLGGGARVRAGVEFDALGRRVAYHLYRERPGEGLLSLDTVRVRASEMLHLFVTLEAGQVRGLTWLAPVLLRAFDLDGYEDATLKRQKIANLFAGFITDPDGSAAGLTTTTAEDGKRETTIEAGAMVDLPPGKSITFSQPGEAGDTYEPFVKQQLRAIAAGLGVTYDQLSGDLAGANYSSLRAGLVEFRRRIGALQHNVVVFQFCRPVWSRFIAAAALAGHIPARDLEQFPQRYTAKWNAPGFDWVDPLKDVQAEIAAIAAGLKSRSEIISARGYDPEVIDAEIAAERERATRLGIALPSTGTDG